jgi:hypothetical protein
VVEHGSERTVILRRGTGAQGKVGEADTPTRTQHPVQLAH